MCIPTPHRAAKTYIASQPRGQEDMATVAFEALPSIELIDALNGSAQDLTVQDVAIGYGCAGLCSYSNSIAKILVVDERKRLMSTQLAV